MILLQVQQVARHFGADTLFSNINMDIQDNSRIALVGRNGAGKSTLIKMITGQQKPDEGSIVERKGITIGYLAQDTGLDSDNTIYEEMRSVFQNLIDTEEQIHQMEHQISQATNHDAAYDNLLKQYEQTMHDFQENNGYGFENEIKAVLHGFHFEPEDYERQINSLSGGQKTRLALAKLLLEKRDLLILDEPTNHLDIETLTWLEGYIQTYTGALLIVSHDRYFLDKIVNEVYEINNGKINHYIGNYSNYIVQKKARLEQEWKEYEKQQDKIKKLQDFVDKNIVRASTTKRAQSRRKQLEKIDVLDKPEKEQKGPRFSFYTNTESGNIVLNVDNAAIGYNDKIISKPVNIDLRKHNVLAIVGPNGIGKSTLLKSILGIIPLISGTVTFGSNVTIGYYDQEQQNLHPNKTVLSEIWDEHPTTPEGDIRSILGSFLFSGDDVNKTVYNLSGGEKARLTLTKLAFRHDNFLILDEPTNHLDIDSKEVLEQAITNFNGTVLFVSHDRYFINKVATSVVEIDKTGSTLYLGNYDYYVEKKREQELLQQAKEQENNHVTKEVSVGMKDYQQSKQQQREERKLRRIVEGLEQQLEECEKEVARIEELMTKPESFNNQQKMQELQQELQQAKSALNDIEEKWEEASLKLEEISE